LTARHTEAIKNYFLNTNILRLFSLVLIAAEVYTGSSKMIVFNRELSDIAVFLKRKPQAWSLHPPRCR
jgi:hypothetical protein